MSQSLSNLQYLPAFGWIGVAALLLFVCAVVIMGVAKKKRLPKVRKYHVLIGAMALMLAAIHGFLAISRYLG